MPNVTLTFNHTINVSVQVGDIAYFVVTDPVGPPGTNGNWAATTTPPMGAFIMFSKDNKANLSSLLGYYSLVRLRNNSKTEAELFGIGADFIESSK